mgnify:CR=1 FL=1
MALKIAIIKETAQFEKRIAASRETVKKLTSSGCSVFIETGAGLNAAITDEMFAEAGAKIEPFPSTTLKDADIVLKVQAPHPKELAQIKKGALLIGILSPYNNQNFLNALAQASEHITRLVGVLFRGGTRVGLMAQLVQQLSRRPAYA